MFSPNVKKELDTTVASFKFDSIKDICVQLTIDAQEEGFLDHSSIDIEETANNFVKSFALNHGLTMHTVTPLSWRFDIDDKHAFDDGIIELRLNGNQQAYFVYIDVSNVKITGPTLQQHDVQMLKGHVIDLNKEVLKRLSWQLEEWKTQLIFVEEQSREHLSNTLSYMEAKIDEIKKDTSDLSHDVLREYKKLWRNFESQIMGKLNKKQ